MELANFLTRFRTTLACSMVWAVGFVFVGPSEAQHYLRRGDDAPGLVAQKRLMAKPELAGFVQPVRIVTPEGSLVSTWSRQGIGPTHQAEVSAGLSIGQVYRIKVTNIKRYPNTELYPSIEVIDRLYPPQGLQHQFPIEIVINQNDLEQAIQGKLVTKVVYLEDGELSLPYRAVKHDQPYIDIGRTEDPIQTAEGLGRPMAIVRIGSRVPLPDDMMRGEFDFNSAPVMETPPTQPFHPATEAVDEFGGPVDPRQPRRNLPPIVRGGGAEK